MILEKPFFDQLQGPGVREAVWAGLGAPTAVASYDGFLVSGSTFGRKSLLHEPF